MYFVIGFAHYLVGSNAVMTRFADNAEAILYVHMRIPLWAAVGCCVGCYGP